MKSPGISNYSAAEIDKIGFFLFNRFVRIASERQGYFPVFFCFTKEIIWLEIAELAEGDRLYRGINFSPQGSVTDAVGTEKMES